MLGTIKKDLSRCMTFITNGHLVQLRNVNLYYPKFKKMKNKYVMSPNYILTLENEELRDRVMELTKQFNELKKKYENEFAEGVVQNKGIHEIIQERQVN